MRNPLIIFATLSLTACAPGTYQNLKADHAGEITFTVKESASTVYQVIRSQAQRCYQADVYGGLPFPTAFMVVDGSLDSATNKGVVTIALKGALGTDMYLAMSIEPIDDVSSTVNVTYALNTWKQKAQAIEHWITGSRACK